MSDGNMVWVYWGSLTCHPGRYCERLQKVNRSTLPDGVGHPSRAAAKAHRRRCPSAPPAWLDDNETPAGPSMYQAVAEKGPHSE